jgi:crotonobetainyl-CoA:carnitine CoA-transferase CaiB-like acyl-CoA transferase
MTKSILSDLRVVELSDEVAGAFCGKLLAERGAHVVKVEPLEGDPARRKGPFPATGPDSESSALFLHLNTTKKSVMLDVSTREGQRQLRGLIAGADIFVECSRPGRMDALGLPYDDVQIDNPHLIYVSISPYGQTGPYRDYKGNALSALALSSVMSVSGHPDREPLAAGVDVADYFAGAQACVAVLAALLYRDRYGGGQYVDVSEMESVATADESVQVLYGFTGAIRRRYYSRHVWGYPQDPFPCKDGHVFVHPGPQGFATPLNDGVSALALIIGRPELDESPLFNSRWERWFNWRELDEILEPWLMSQTAEDLVPIAQALKMPFGPFLNVAQLLENEHLRSRGFFRELEHPVAGKLEYAGQPVRMSVEPSLLERAPLLGEHNALLQAPPRKKNITKPRETSSPSGALPLSGVRVLDLTQVWAGPTCTAILAALGADVVRVEGLSRQDVAHTILTNEGVPSEPWNCGPYYQYHNADKRTIALDLLQEEGIAVFKRLVPAFDVVVEAFSPRVMHNFGLTYDVLRQIRPDLIMASLSGYGQNGLYRDYAAYGMGLESVCGIGSVTGYPDLIMRTGVSHNDPISGFAAAGAIMMALRRRAQTGEGQYIDLSEHEIGVSQVGPEILGYQLNGRIPGPRGNRREGVVQGCYRCAGYDNWLVVSTRDDDEWQAFCHATGHDDWADDERFRTADRRYANHDLLDKLIEEWTSKQPQMDAFHLLQKVGVIAAPVLDGKTMLLDPHFRARNHCDLIDHGSRFGLRLIPRHLTPKFSRMDPHPTKCAPLFGEHNYEVLHELGGYTDEEMAGLEERHVIGNRPILQLEGEELLAYLVETLTYPLERLVEQGALRAMEPDYLTQLGLRKPAIDP